MKLDIDRSLDLPVSAARAWAFLERIDAVASCLPGAAITEKIDDTHYRGTVSVRLGPASLSFQGTVEIVERDPAKRELHIVGKGADKGGSSVAEAELTAAVVDRGPNASHVGGKATLTVNGKAAAFGARLMNSVAEQLIKEFYANLLKNLQAEPVIDVARPAAADRRSPSAATATIVPAQGLNGFAFIWSVLKSFIADLFGGKRRA
jgi:carbon monoxide dehydrogenase subunit G